MRRRQNWSVLCSHHPDRLDHNQETQHTKGTRQVHEPVILARSLAVISMPPHGPQQGLRVSGLSEKASREPHMSTTMHLHCIELQ